ncbi:MAG: hypothetical protein JST44_14335 [Cyanobacteria bacterium SZAS LIN-5]|nr:hypothetical protein [Cyanobacteria bacterium SZAS LIN-5]RTL41753.1 MAG: hypothetical protein EKK48_12590 [Candidatus Melainabacteria bacterium]
MSTSRKKAGPQLSKPRNWPPKSVLEPGTSHKWVPVVAFDFHEVVVSFMEQFARVANASYPGANLDASKAGFYNFGYDPEVGINPVEFQHLFKHFCMLSSGGYGDLPMIPGIKEQMEAIKAAGIGITILTWVPGATDVVGDDKNPLHSGIAQRETIRLIEKLGLPVDVDRDVKFISPNQKPGYLGKKHIPLLVEDNRTTAVAVADMAHAAILVPTSYNQVTCPNVLRLKSRDELSARVIGFYEELRSRGLLLEGRR